MSDNGGEERGLYGPSRRVLGIVDPPQRVRRLLREGRFPRCVAIERHGQAPHEKLVDQRRALGGQEIHGLPAVDAVSGDRDVLRQPGGRIAISAGDDPSLRVLRVAFLQERLLRDDGDRPSRVGGSEGRRETGDPRAQNDQVELACLRCPHVRDLRLPAQAILREKSRDRTECVMAPTEM